jgi:hypothetical protein
VPLLVMAFWIGLYPKPFFQILEQPVNQLVQNVRGPQYGGAQNAAAKPEISIAPVATASVSNAATAAKGKN